MDGRIVEVVDLTTNRRQRVTTDHQGGFSVSLDPERDTPEALRGYARARGADLATWSFLGGPPDEVRAALARWGAGGRRAADGEIEHVLVVFVVDPEGRIARRFVGQEHGADELLLELGRVASG